MYSAPASLSRGVMGRRGGVSNINSSKPVQAFLDPLSFNQNNLRMFNAGDALTDLRCDAASLSASLLPGVGQCRVHRGMWESAVRMDGNLRHTIEEALAPGGPCAGMRLRLVGHSLGAGVASLLTLRWHEMVPLFRQHGVHCHAFGPPCVLDERAAAATRWRPQSSFPRV